MIRRPPRSTLFPYTTALPILYTFRPMLWVLMLAIPFPFIANTAGWYVAELGRQPWLAYGLFRTSEGVSPLVSSGNVLFTLIGFAGIYLKIGRASCRERV